MTCLTSDPNVWTADITTVQYGTNHSETDMLEKIKLHQNSKTSVGGINKVLLGR